MLLSRLFPLLALGAALLAGEAVGATPPPTSARAQSAIAEATGAILRGDANAALRALAAAPDAEFSPRGAMFRACTFARFDRHGPPSLVDRDVNDTFVRDVLSAYRSYWWHALKAPARRDAYEHDLAHLLRGLLGEQDDSADMDTLEPKLDAALAARGYHAQLGTTAPLRELMLWRRQRTRHFQVQLPEGPQAVEADLLDDFVALGWSAYGRCESGSNGGWATAKKLYAVVPAYAKDGGLGSEAFRVVFLAHEAQHLADQNRWPDMLGWELEYRAKLTELALAGQQVGAKRLQGFITAQGDDPGTPHPYANRRVVEALAARLGRAPDQAPAAALRAAARDALRADTAQREQ